MVLEGVGPMCTLDPPHLPGGGPEFTLPHSSLLALAVLAAAVMLFAIVVRGGRVRAGNQGGFSLFF